MYAHSVRPEELCITNELISDSIKKNGDIEWRSEKEFLDFIFENRDLVDWRVIGYVTTKTLKKWGKEIKNNNTLNGREVDEKFWVLARGNEYWFVDKFVF